MTLNEFSKHFEGKSLEEIKVEAAREGFEVKAEQRDAAIAELFAAVEAHQPAPKAPEPAPKAPKSPSGDKPRRSPSADKAPAPAVAGPVTYEGRSLTGGPFRKAERVFMPGKWHDIGEVDAPTLAVLERYRKVGHIAFRIKG